MTKVSPRDVVRLRLAAQRISGEPSASVADAARWMTAMQGQDFAAVQWGLALRTRDATRQHVLDAFARATIVRSWPMRGTLHVVAAEDLAWMLSLTSDRLIRSAATRRKNLGLTDRMLADARDTVTQGLAGGRSASRAELYELLTTAGIDTAGQRGYHMLWYLAQTGVVCFGPPHGSQQAVVLLDEWVPRPRRLDGDEALAEWARRYFASHGPATVHDFAWWSSLTLAQARRGLAAAADDLEARDLDGVTHFLDASTQATRDGVRVLPPFDEYLLGYRDRAPQLDPAVAGRVVPGGNGVFRPIVVRDGTVVGTWHANPRASGQPELFAELSARDLAALARRGDAFSTFWAAEHTRSPLPHPERSGRADRGSRTA